MSTIGDAVICKNCYKLILKTKKSSKIPRKTLTFILRTAIEASSEQCRKLLEIERKVDKAQYLKI